MSDSFGSGSSVKILQWLTQYKKLSERSPQSLTEPETERLQELEVKLASFLSKNSKTGSKPPPADVRTSLRVDTNYSVRLNTVGDFKKAYMRNVSGGGLFVETDQFVEIGTRVKLQALLPEDIQPLEIESVVAWINPKRTISTPQGLGLKFLNMSEEDRRKIQKFINLTLDHQIKASTKEKKK